MDEELKIAKKTIRSLLISVKEGLTVRELESDYVEFEGVKLPFAKFGFQNAHDFLQSLTDVVYFFRDKNGEERMKQVSDESTAHIEKLVARQKSLPKKKKSKPPLTRQFLQQVGTRGRRGGNSRGGRQSFRGHSQSVTNHRHEQPVIKPLFSTPQREPRNNRQPLIGLLPTSSSTRSTHASYGRVKAPCSGRSLDVVSKDVNQGSAAVQDPYGKQLPSQSYSQPHGQSQSQSQSQKSLAWDDTDDHGSNDQPDEDEDEKWNKPPSPEDECIVNKGVQDKVKQVLAKAPKGLWANRLPVMYKQLFKQELPLKDYGHHSVIEFVSAMPHLVRIERPYEKGDWLLTDMSVPRPEPEEPANRNQQNLGQGIRQTNVGAHKLRVDSSKVPFKSLADFKESVRQVLQHHGDGVTLLHFPKVYQEMTGYKLDPQALGQEDMFSLLAFLAEEDVLIIQYDGQESTRLVSASFSGIRRFDLLKEAYKPHPNYGVTLSQQNAPQGVVGRGRCFPPAAMDGIEKGQKVEVHVSSVVSPNYFWVQNRSYISRLDDLMDDLEKEYSENAGKYRMPPSMMMHGQVCAALYEDSNWHRGIVTGASDGKVMVYYVDYGNSSPVDPATICFLAEKFLSLPVQAIQAKLAFLLPPNGQKNFSKRAKDELLAMVLQRPLVAMISEVSNLVLSVVLVDTTGKEDYCINDRLVDRGLASFVSEEALFKEEGPLADRRVDAYPLLGDATSAGPYIGEGRRYVRLMEFSPDIEFHTVCLGGDLYILSSEISFLFWEDDCLAYMLQQEKVVMHKLVVGRQQHPGLFDELARRGAFHADENMKLLNLYQLENLPMLLDMFGDRSQKAEELKIFVKNYLRNFDPDDLYWKGADEDARSCDTSDSTGTGEDSDLDPDRVLTLEELQQALHSMQINRKRILKRMTSSEQDCISELVQELEGAEDSILLIQELIYSLEQNHSTDLKLPGSGKAQPALPDSAQTVAPQSKTLTSTCPEPRGAVKTNVVTPMVKPATAPPPPSNAGLRGATPRVALTDLQPESLELANRQLAEEIRHNDRIINSMLGGGGGGALNWMLPGGGLQPFPPPQVGSLPLSSAALPGNPNPPPSAHALGHNPAPFPPNPTAPKSSRLPSMFSSSLYSQPHVVPNAFLPSAHPPLHAQSQSPLDAFIPGSTPASDKNLGAETAASDRKPRTRHQELTAGLPPSVSAATLDPLSVPAVGVVHPHPAVQPSAYPTTAQAGRAYPVAQLPSLLSLSSSTQPFLGPAGGGFGGSVAAPWPNPSCSTALHQRFLQLQQRQMALYQQQAMFRPRLMSGPLLPLPLPVPPHPSAVSLLPPATTPAVGGEGDGSGQLLPGLMPLLQSLQESCSVSASSPPPPQPPASSAVSLSQ